MGQAGKPKSITGFQTHTTPVLLAFGERAELATTECILSHFQYAIVVYSCFLDTSTDIPLSPFVEGFIVLRKNPDYEEN